MTDQTQQPKLSEKVTPPLLDRMYNNFTKITDWVMKGKESKYPMPKALAWLFKTTEQNANEVAELKQLVTTLQNNLVQKEQRLGEAQSRINALDNTLRDINATLKQFVDLANIPQTQSVVVPDPVVTTPAPQPAPAPVEVVDELVDLDDVVSGNVNAVASGAVPSAQVSPNEQAIQVSAEAVGAGNIDPASYQALDAEIGALLG